MGMAGPQEGNRTQATPLMGEGWMMVDVVDETSSRVMGEPLRSSHAPHLLSTKYTSSRSVGWFNIINLNLNFLCVR